MISMVIGLMNKHNSDVGKNNILSQSCTEEVATEVVQDLGTAVKHLKIFLKEETELCSIT